MGQPSVRGVYVISWDKLSVKPESLIGRSLQANSNDIERNPLNNQGGASRRETCHSHLLSNMHKDMQRSG